MKMRVCFFYTILCLIAFYVQLSFAIIYPLPQDKSRLVGKNLMFTIPKDNKLPLEHFAAHFQIGLSNMLEANPDIDVYLPTPGAKIIIPHQLILPDTPYKGIVINSAEMRLYYYPKDTKIVIVLPIGIGEPGKETPSNWKTSVKRKKIYPTWTPTEAMRLEYAERGEILPNIVPAGPNNPMGLYALYIGKLYAIHGTNTNFGIGLRVSHGCVRLRAADIEYLFKRVPIGTPVQFINEPVKTTIEPDGSYYMEVHNPLSEKEEQWRSTEPVPIHLSAKINSIVSSLSVSKDAVNEALQRRSGIPKNISFKKE